MFLGFFSSNSNIIDCLRLVMAVVCSANSGYASSILTLDRESITRDESVACEVICRELSDKEVLDDIDSKIIRTESKSKHKLRFAVDKYRDNNILPDSREVFVIWDQAVESTPEEGPQPEKDNLRSETHTLGTHSTFKALFDRHKDLHRSSFAVNTFWIEPVQQTLRYRIFPDKISQSIFSYKNLLRKIAENSNFNSYQQCQVSSFSLNDSGAPVSNTIPSSTFRDTIVDSVDYGAISLRASTYGKKQIVGEREFWSISTHGKIKNVTYANFQSARRDAEARLSHLKNIGFCKSN